MLKSIRRTERLWTESTSQMLDQTGALIMGSHQARNEIRSDGRIWSWPDPSNRLNGNEGTTRRAIDAPRAVALFVFEDEGDRLVFGSFDADQHSAIRGKGVAFESNRAGLGSRHL